MNSTISGLGTAASQRYDRLTRAFHWLTAALVVFMFAVFSDLIGYGA